MATDSPQRSPANPDTLFVHLKPHLAEGWYLVYWRAISVDGHPVQGAFTFAVGPNPGPAPQFVIPHIAKSATTTALVVAKWAMFLTIMASIGLAAMRLAIGRPLVRRVAGASLRPVTVAFAIASTAALVLVPVFLEESTSVDSLHGFFDVGALVPLWRTTAYGRAFVDLELVFALFARRRPGSRSGSTGPTARSGRSPRSWRESASSRPRRPSSSSPAPPATPRRPRRAGWPWRSTGSTSPRAPSGWAASSASCSCGRRSPRSRRVAGLAVVVPRFSNVALVSVAVLLGSGIWAVGAQAADPLGAVDDLVRADDPREGLAPRGGDGLRRRQLRRQPASPRRGALQARGRAARRLAPRRDHLRRGADPDRRDRGCGRAHQPRSAVEVPRPGERGARRTSAPAPSPPSSRRTGIR